METNKIKQKLFIITGTSGSGKSTLSLNLNKILAKGYKSFDYDEVGNEYDLDKGNIWLQKFLELKKQKITPILCGAILPENFLENDLANHFEIHWGYIDISEYNIRSRLEKRREFTKKSGKNPWVHEWNDELITNNIYWALQIKEQVEKQINYHIIDSENISSTKLAELFNNWILKTVEKLN